MEPNGLLSPSVLIPVAGVAVVLLGIVVALVRASMGRKSLAALDRWGHAAFSLWTGGEDCASWTPQRAQGALKDWYGATGAPAFWDVIRGLRQGTTGNAAWDGVRALDLLRIGVAAGYIDADQCRTETAAIGAELQRRYKSWEELAQNFEAGMQAWQRSRNITDPQETGRVQRNLPKLRQELWPAAPYATTLAADD